MRYWSLLQQQVIEQEEVASTFCHGMFRLDIGKYFATQRVVKCWNRLSREVVQSPSMEVFKTMLKWHLEIVFSGEHRNSLLMIGHNDLRGLFQPKCSYDSMILKRLLALL